MRTKSDWYNQAKTFSYKEWNERIMRLPTKAEQIKVLSIIQWDFFSDQTSPYAVFQEMSKLIGSSCPDMDDLTPAQIIKALCEVGYPEDEALARIKAVPVLYCQDSESRSTGTRRECGVVSFLFAVGEQAVLDIKNLIQKGIIVDGKINPHWNPKAWSTVAGYNSKDEVQKLIEWVVGGGMESYLKSLDVELDMDKVVTALGLCKEPVKRAHKKNTQHAA
jgi:hypothetical protein